ncbi:DUF4249 domain-containing protein [Limibacter armeniacum]|uniref:DUF4249 domain-containing protein n=1 Tax=Limibacter armeniacum TaxID=466084 RepID=UPI002FE4FDEA
MKNLLFYILLLSTLSVFCSCEKLVNPDLITIDPVVVVDAQIGNDTSYVRLTRTTAFSSAEPIPVIQEASVRLKEDGKDVEYLFREQFPGWYIPISKNFEPVPGRSYILSAVTEGVSYVATSQMQPQPVLDTVMVNFVEDGRDDFRDEGYYISLLFQDTPIRSDYYRVEAFLNGFNLSLLPDVGIMLESDNGKDGRLLVYEIPYAFSDGDSVSVKLRSLSEDSFEYYNSLKLLSDAGSPSQAVPENPPSNVKADADDIKALGLFSAENTTSIEVVIGGVDEEE